MGTRPNLAKASGGRKGCDTDLRLITVSSEAFASERINARMLGFFFFLLQQVNQTITRIVRILTQPEMTPWVQAGNMCTSRPWGGRQDPHTPVLEPRDSACGPLSFCGSCPPRRRWQFSGNLWFSRKPLATSQTAGVGWAWLGKVVLVGTAQLSTSGSRPDRKRQKIQISF